MHTSYTIGITALVLVSFTIPVFGQEIGFYENELYEFSFEAPLDWKYQENVEAADGSVIQVMIFPKEFNPLLQIDTPQIIVAFENIPESKVPHLSGQAIEKYHIEQIRSEKFSGGKIISTHVQDKSWGWIISTDFIFSQNFGFNVIEQYHTNQKAFHFKNRELYTVAYFATDDYFNRYLPVFENVVRSIEIKGIKVSQPEPAFALSSTEGNNGGGCLIATATFGSELEPQVQFLREIRDNTVLSTMSGTSFMTGFNSFYYSFSPTIADLERQNPMFKETVKIAITPLLSSLSLLQYVNIDSEAEMLGYGIGIILLNIGMYFVAPAILITKLKNIPK